MIRHRAAFTLIELLMVIAIISLLMSMAFVMWGIIQARANKTSTQSLLTKVGKAIELYKNDYGSAPLFQDPAFSAGDWTQAHKNNTMLYTILCTKDATGVYQGGRQRPWPGYLVGDTDLGLAADASTRMIRDLWGQPLLYVSRKDLKGVSTQNWGWPSGFKINDIRKFDFELWSAGKDGEFSLIRGSAVAATAANTASVDNDNIPGGAYDPSDLRYQ